MLILSRKLNEEIKISSDITIKILSISENQIKIGIEAPGSIEILRGEIFENIKKNTIEASQKAKSKPANVGKLKLNKLRNG